MKRRDFLKTTSAAAAGAVAAAYIRPANAQSRKDTLLALSEAGPNNLDIMGIGTNRPGYEASWNTYDRLVTFGVKKDAAGTDHYDHQKIEPELAESWDLGDKSVTFKLRKDAVFHDGTPVTAKDVKWSFDRAVTVGGFPTFQMKAGSLEKPEQFVAVDDNTFRIDFLRTDKLTMPDLGVPVPIVINSGLAKKHATDADPWALEWLKNNEAGGGAFHIDKYTPGQELIYGRFDKWKSGPMPKLERVIWRIVPSAGNRRALLERGDADISFDLPPKDVSELAKEAKVTVVGTPIENALIYIGMNVKIKPFDNVKVRQAIAYAIPYQKIMDAVMFGRGIPMFGGPAEVTKPVWPQPSPYTTDIPKAKQLMAEAGMADGFETTLSFDLGSAVVGEPLSILVQESLAQIGVKLTLNKIPSANWRAEFSKKTLPFIVNAFGGWLNFPEYFFYWAYHGQNAIFNTMSYQNPAMDKLIDAARFDPNPKTYDEEVIGFIKTAFVDIPRIPVFQPSLDVAMQKNITGYRYWFHRQLDYRPLAKT
ncbi:MAG TPA: ABC transporter substrate-binding protein [Stellaceae bacterium]|jgi:peptide/nickel transport system substrate-binding protein|nr:ABC transporter substrate-binding protein [Stellaceae bacterium]